jgi:hypothetical protein
MSAKLLPTDHYLRLYNRHRSSQRTEALAAARSLAALLGVTVTTDDEADQFACGWLWATSPGLAPRGMEVTRG